MQRMWKDMVRMSIEENKARYEAAAHAMMTGVSYVMQYDPNETDLKHMKVGINNSFIGQAVILQILIRKNIITEEEYWEELVIFMEKEVEMYKQRLEEYLPGTDITLR